MSHTLSSHAPRFGSQTSDPAQPEQIADPEARLAALRALMPYEEPQVVSLPLGGSPRIFPVYMGNM